MTLTPREALLCLILIGKSDQSAIRPGAFTAEQALTLTEALQAHARGGEAEE